MGLLLVLALAACGDARRPSPAQRASRATAQDQRVIKVSDVEGLYAAVNDPENDGVQIVLAGGRTYKLTETVCTGGATALCPKRANLGRLVLRSGMDLIGQNQYSRDLHGLPIAKDPHPDSGTETVVDGAALLGSGGVAGVIHAGLDNRIRGITVVGNVKLTAEILVDQLPAESGNGMSVEIRDCIVEKGQRGIHFVVRKTAADTTSTAIIEGNVLRHNGGSNGNGIQLLQDSAPNARIDAKIRRNLVYDNNVGLFIPMVGARDSETTVHSEGNVYTANKIGITIIGGRDFGLPRGQPLPPGVELPASSRNRIMLDSDGDVLANNVAALEPSCKTCQWSNGGVGILAVAGLRDCPPLGFGTKCGRTVPPGPNGGDVSDNEVWLRFKGTIFVRGSANQNGTPDGSRRSDLRIIGADSGAGAGLLPIETSLPGTGNVVTVVVREATSDNAPGAFATADSTLPDPGGTNRVIATVIGSNDLPDPTPFLAP